MNVTRTEQVGSKDKGTVKHTHEQRVLALVVTFDFLSEAFNLLGNLITSDIRHKRQALISNFFHLLKELKHKVTKKFSVFPFSCLYFLLRRGNKRAAMHTDKRAGG
jgi:hypothetical protein